MAKAIIRTPEGPVAMIPPVVKKLEQLGHVWLEADGYHAASKDAICKLVAAGDAGVCDFCSAPDPIVAIFEVADFNMGTLILDGKPAENRSTGGWAACVKCAALVNADDRSALLKRAIAGSSDPDHLMVQAAITQLHQGFWKARVKPKLSDDGAGLAGSLAAVKEYLDGQGRDSSQAHRHERIRLLAKRLNISVETVRRIADMTTPKQLADYVVSLEGQQDEMAAALRQLHAQIDDLKAKMGPDALANAQHRPAWFDRNRPWMEALEAQFIALADLTRYRTRARTDREVPRLIAGSWDTDIALLSKAECYTWGPEPMAACTLAAKTVPADTRLSLGMMPSNAPGWWYFPGPLPLKTTSREDGIIALLWGWTKDRREAQPVLVFSCFVVGRDRGARGEVVHVPMPSQQWTWAEGESVSELLTRCSQEYDEANRDAELAAMQAREKFNPMPKPDTQVVTEAIARFFLAACAWMQQKIVTFDSGHVERHRRKQLHREHKLDAAPADVKIIQLRRMEPRHHDPAAGRTAEAVDWACRWVVGGHWRNQPYGTKRGDRKLIYINPYVKGPDDKPLKVPTHQVYVVNR